MKWPMRVCVCAFLLCSVSVSAYDDKASDASDIRRHAVMLRPGSLGGQVYLKALDVGKEMFFVGVEGIAIRWRKGQERPQQLKIPIDVTLTSVCFADLKRGWMGGSEGSMFATKDGGVSWQLINVGLASDGPILDILCNNTGLVIGLSVFGQLTISDDGGGTWRPLALQAVTNDGEEFDPHLLSIGHLNNGRLLIVGEMGVGFTSNDGGKSWQEMRDVSGVTLFGQLQTASGRTYVYGMDGRIWELDANEATWSPIDTGVRQSIFAATERDGEVLFFGEEGVWIALKPSAGNPLVSSGFTRERASVFAAYSQIDSTLLLTKEGVYRVKIDGSKIRPKAGIERGEKPWR